MLSYSGLVNYGKSTLPSVEAWNTNTNIVRDPPRAIMTRRIDKVGDTSQIAATLADSDDRFCEAINYYARGINPMVTVSYGEGQTTANTSNKGQAFLPYRVIRDGAFRPPILRQEDLLPLSRLPRNWTTVDPRPFEIDYTKRIFDCGTAESTYEVKNTLLKTSCEARKTIAADPQLTVPQVKYMLKDPLAPSLQTNPSDAQTNISSERPNINMMLNRPYTSGYSNKNATKEEPIVLNNVTLERNAPMSSQYTNKSGIKENPIDINNISLERNIPMSSQYSNKTFSKEEPVVLNNVNLERNVPMSSQFSNKNAVKEQPIVLNNVKLARNVPISSQFANKSGPIYNVEFTDINFNRLATKTSPGGYEGRPYIPPMSSDVVLPTLLKVR